MADKNPFANVGLGEFGREGQGSGGLGTVGALYLAHKAGLIDLNNKDQMNSIQKNGLFGHVAMNAIQGAVAPQNPISQFQINPSGVSNADNADIGGGFNPAGIPPVQMGAPVAPPNSNNIGMDSQMSNLDKQQTEVADFDHDMIDQSLPNFANLILGA